MNKEYKYDAFISYRHSDLDKFVAENLHKALETYELPKNIKEKLNIKGRTIKRIFRDQDELPLSSNLEDPIVSALKDSKYLIVICSPRLKESLWCKKEIETFKKLRGRENIFCVLIEGEPEDSFPEEVLFDEKITKDSNGKKIKTKEYFEPLAADVRGDNKSEILKKIKSEKLRLIAPMYNLNYDDLKQRHRQRKIKRIITISTLAAITFFIISLYSTIMFLKISSQQKKLKKHQALSLVDKSNTYLSKDSRYTAVKSAYESLTKFNGVKMPYTSDAEYALVESLGVYNAGTSFKALSELKTKGVIDRIKVSVDGNYALTIDESDEITVWDLTKLKKVNAFNDVDSFVSLDTQFTFVGDNNFAYITRDGNVKILSLKNGKVLKVIEKKENKYKSVSSDETGKFIAINDSPVLYLYNLENYELLGEYKINKDNAFSNEMLFSQDGKLLFVFSSVKSLEFNKEISSIIHVFNTSDFTEIDKINIDAEYFEDLAEDDNNIYILANQSSGLENIHAVLISYDKKKHKINYTKTISDSFAKFMQCGLSDESNTLAIVSGNKVDVINRNNGEFVKSFVTSSDIIGIYASYTSDLYLTFSTDGSVNFMSVKERESLIYPGLYELNAAPYSFVIKNETGYLLVPKYDNRIIYYEKYVNNKAKETTDKYDLVSDQGVKPSEQEKLKEEYNFKKKNLIKKIIYADNKKILVVSYTDNSAAFYSVKDKKFITMVNDVSQLYHDFGKDKNNRIYLGNTSNTYIFDEDYNKVGHIKSMISLDKKNNTVVISNNGKYYKTPIYSYKELLNEAAKYLNE